MNTLAAAALAVNPTPATEAQLDADRSRLEADYAAYSAWLDANADELAGEAEAYELAGEAEAYELYEAGHPAW